MAPAFRSAQSALLFSASLLLLLFLPILLFWAGLPSREQTWSGIPSRLGAVGDVVHTINDKRNADIIFVGSSLTRRAIDLHSLESSLSHHLGRAADIGELSMSWPGVDLQYFMLRDYLEHHHPQVIVWNVPETVSNTTEAHVQAYRWMRFGEFEDAFSSMPLFFKVQLYGEMVLGAPKQLLYKIRSNLLSRNEELDRNGYDVNQFLHTGYHNAPFESDTLADAPRPTAVLLPVTSSLLSVQGPAPNAFELKYIHAMVALAKRNSCTLVLLHIPVDSEYGYQRIPEVADWSSLLGTQYRMIGIPSSTLFPGFALGRYLHFFSDGHLNANGRSVFTSAITPSVLRVYDDSK